MAIVKGDVVFARGGEPVLITAKDPRTGKVKVDKDFAAVQEATEIGVKNGLRENEREAFKTVLSEVRSDDARSEIDALSKRIESLRRDGADPRLLRYLKGELQFRMSKERYEPANREIDELTLLSS